MRGMPLVINNRLKGLLDIIKSQKTLEVTRHDKRFIDLINKLNGYGFPVEQYEVRYNNIINSKEEFYLPKQL